MLDVRFEKGVFVTGSGAGDYLYSMGIRPNAMFRKAPLLPSWLTHARPAFLRQSAIRGGRLMKLLAGVWVSSRTVRQRA